MDFKIKNPNKRVNVISMEIRDMKGEVVQQGNILLRTTRSYAAQLFANGTHTYTSKGKLKSFLNKTMKLHHNAKVIEKLDFTAKNCPHRVIEDKFSGKTYVLRFMKNVKHTVKIKGIDNGETNPLTGLPANLRVMEIPKYQSLIAKFPN